MRVSFRIAPLLLFVAVFQVTAGQERPGGEGGDRSFYLIGNSLTWDTVPSRLDEDVQWHVDCGKSLPFMYENPEKPCVESSTLWPEALEKKQYDVISLQIHYGSNLAEDAAVVSTLIDLQPNARVVLHTGWARSESREDEYEGGLPDAGPSAKMVHSPEYFAELLKTLRAAHPGRDFRLTHAQDVLDRVARDIAAGEAPFEKIEDVYRDAIHMDRVTGRYLMHNVMRSALGQAPSIGGFEKIGEEEKAYFDEVLADLDSIAARVDPERPASAPEDGKAEAR